MDEIAAVPVQWRDMWFDSTLEADWAASMTVWNVDWQHHPGSIDLSNGERYEPDFLLKNAGPFGMDIMLEVKGPADDRIHKPQILQQDNPELMVLIGRVPWLRADDMSQYPAAVWHKADEAATEWVWDLNGRGEEFVTGESASREGLPGLKFYKALAGTRQIR